MWVGVATVPCLTIPSHLIFIPTCCWLCLIWALDQPWNVNNNNNCFLIRRSRRSDIFITAQQPDIISSCSLTVAAAAAAFLATYLPLHHLQQSIGIINGTIDATRWTQRKQIYFYFYLSALTLLVSLFVPPLQPDRHPGRAQGTVHKSFPQWTTSEHSSGGGYIAGVCAKQQKFY